VWKTNCVPFATIMPCAENKKPARRRAFVELEDQELDPGLGQAEPVLSLSKDRGEALAKPCALRTGQLQETKNPPDGGLLLNIGIKSWTPASARPSLS
jgi:hypothetical protein